VTSRPWNQSEEVWFIHVGFWSKPSVKVEIKPHERWLVIVKYCDLLDWIRAKWLRIDKKIVPVSEKLRRNPWALRQQGWSSPTEIDINDGKRRLFDISSALSSGVWDWMADIVTVIDIATPRWLLKSSEDKSLRSCERAQLLAFARLQSLG